MTVNTVYENKANKENYEQAQATIDKVLEKVAAIKESDANREIKRQIDELDEAYERAIRLRMMRIDTLVAHCEDRDTELVSLRTQKNKLETSKYRALIGFAVSVIISAATALHIVAPHLVLVALQYTMLAATIVCDTLSNNALCAAVVSGIATFVAMRVLSK